MSMPSFLRVEGRKLVRNDVGGVDEPVQDVATFGTGQVQSDRPLTPVVILERPTGATGLQRPAEQATGVWRVGVLDLDDVGAPLGEHAAGRGYERPHGQVDHSDAIEHGCHRLPRF